MKNLSNYSHLIINQWLTYKNRRNLGLVTILVTFLLALAIVSAPFGVFRGRIVNAAGLTTTDLNTITKEDLVQTIVGPGVSYSNVTYTGASVAAGTFSGGTGIIGFESGIVLSSGGIQDVVGPNNSTSKSGNNGTSGDGNLSTLAGGSTFDAAVLEFDFVPETSSLSFQYVFGSEEYNEYANTQYNDVFAFYLDGVNIALIPSTTTPVAIT